MTRPAQDLLIPAPTTDVVDVVFQAETIGDRVRVGLIALGEDGSPAEGFSADVDLAAARLWRDQLDRAIGSGMARSFARQA